MYITINFSFKIRKNNSNNCISSLSTVLASNERVRARRDDDGNVWRIKPERGNTWGDSDEILYITVNAAILQAFPLKHRDVKNSRMLENCCVWNYTSVEIRGLRITLTWNFSTFPQFYHVFVCVMYTSNMVVASSYDVTASRVFSSIKKWEWFGRGTPARWRTRGVLIPATGRVL